MAWWVYGYGLLCGLILASAAWATHGHWISHYTDATGTPCCGLHDCVAVHLRVVRSDAVTVTIEINGYAPFPLPQGSFYPSEDREDWWCAKSVAEPPSALNTRCAFLAIGS